MNKCLFKNDKFIVYPGEYFGIVILQEGKEDITLTQEFVEDVKQFMTFDLFGDWLCTKMDVEGKEFKELFDWMKVSHKQNEKE